MNLPNLTDPTDAVGALSTAPRSWRTPRTPARGAVGNAVLIRPLGVHRFCTPARIRAGSGNPAQSGGAGRCTNRQRNAHVTESRVVLYRWHPWHGRSVVIVGAVGTGQHARYRCVLEHVDDSRSFEVPQWMFDAAACCRSALSPTPAVACEVLRELRLLIDSACRPDVEAVLQAGHLAIPDPGGACATRESSAFGRSAGSVSPASIDSAVGGLAGGSAPASGLAAGTVTAQPSPRSSRRATRSGDAR